MSDGYDYFGSLNQEAIDAQKKADLDAAGANKYVMTKDKSLWRLRFYKRREGLAFHPCRQHWIQNPDGGGKISVICRQLIKEACPICDLVAELEASGNAKDAELAGDMRADFHYLCNVEDLADPNQIRIYRCKVSLYKSLFGTDDKTRAVALHTKYGDFTDPRNGYLIDVTKYDASPWYTANVVIDPVSKMLAVSPAKMELGPKLYDLAKETIVLPLEQVKVYADCIRNGQAFPKREGDKGGRGGGGRPALGNRPQSTISQPAAQQTQPANRGPSIQSKSEAPVMDDSMFDS